MPTKSTSILVVGGDLEARQKLFLHFQKKSFQCLTAANMDNAKLMLMGRRFDLVLCELKLMDGSGLTLCQQIRRSYPQTAVVLLADSVAPRVQAKAQQQGAAALLPKPVEWTQLDQVLHTVLPHNQ